MANIRDSSIGAIVNMLNT